MKKYALLMLFSSLLMAEDLEVNKEVQGQNQKNYVETLAVKDENKPINTGNIKLIDIGLNPANLENKDKINLGIDTKEKIDTTDFTQKVDIFTQKERESRVFFSLGGHDSISNYKYGLIDNSRIEKYGIDYNLFIKRENFEENRSNSKISTDYIKASFTRDKFNLNLDLEKGQQEFPGMKNSTVPVKSDKEFTKFGTEVNYSLTEDTKVGVNYTYGSNSSESLGGTTFTRDYSHSNLEINGSKEFLYKDGNGDHSIDAKLGAFMDKNSNEKNSILFVEGKDRFTLTSLKDTEFNAMVKLEGGKNTNLSLNLIASKKLDEEKKVNAGFYVDSDYTSFKEIIGNSYVNDVVAFRDIKNEKSYGLKGGVTYIKDKLYVNLDASINSSADLITYEAVEVDPTKEKAIVPKNYDKRVGYMDAKAKVSYTKNENLRGEGSFYLSTLKDIAYRPNFRAEAEAIYTNDKYEGRVKYNLNGSMYTKNDGLNVSNREYINSNGTIDFLNTYSFSKDYVLSLNVTNLLDSNGEKMQEYPVNGRMISLGVEIKY